MKKINLAKKRSLKNILKISIKYIKETLMDFQKIFIPFVILGIMITIINILTILFNFYLGGHFEPVKISFEISPIILSAIIITLSSFVFLLTYLIIILAYTNRNNHIHWLRNDRYRY